MIVSFNNLKGMISRVIFKPQIFFSNKTNFSLRKNNKKIFRSKKYKIAKNKKNHYISY